MKKEFSEHDIKFMKLALEEAKLAQISGNFPCGAILSIDDQFVDKRHNMKEVKSDRISHAEMLLYINNSSIIKQAKKENKRVTIYTTLEPCLMCFGAACIHRVDRIVVASPDPYGDMSKLKSVKLGSFYDGNLPEIHYGLSLSDSCNLMIEFLSAKGGDDSMDLIEKLRNLTNVNSSV